MREQIHANTTSSLHVQNVIQSSYKGIAVTDAKPPQYQENFWEVRQVIKEWIDHTAKVFSQSSWVLCLDVSMLIQHSMFTCPGCFSSS